MANDFVMLNPVRLNLILKKLQSWCGWYQPHTSESRVSDGAMSQSRSGKPSDRARAPSGTDP